MDTPARLLLVRHGETDWNRTGKVQGHTDVPLNDRGRAQAATVAPRVADCDIAAIHASDLSRAAESAAIIGAALDLAPRSVPAFREVHLGVEGITDAEVRRTHGELITALVRLGDRPFGPGGETFATFQGRVREGFDALCRDHAGETVMIVSHGGTLKALIADLIGLPPESIGRLSLRQNGGISVVDFRHGRPQLTLLNSAHGSIAP
ncbi:MAG: histidine phosphatase family protein [Planctomycetota bacterium]|nr:histidine phosphatase family protein [Planctomycetota bacterium]